MVKTAPKSAKPCRRNGGEFVPTLRPMHGACRSPAISPRLMNGSQPNFSGGLHVHGIENVWFKLLKSVGVSGWGKMSHSLAGPSNTKSNMACKACSRVETVNPSINKTAYTYILAKCRARLSN